MIVCVGGWDCIRVCREGNNSRYFVGVRDCLRVSVGGGDQMRLYIGSGDFVRLLVGGD